MRFLFSSILFLFLSTIIYAQEGEIQFTIKDHHIEQVFLNSEISQKVLDFEDSKRDDAFGMLPVYTHHIALRSPNFSINAWIENNENTLLPSTEIDALADADKIGIHYHVITSVIFREGHPYAEIMIMPYRRGEVGLIEALVSGTVSYELSESTSIRAPYENFVENSVLSQGLWYRISTEETGIFKIGYDELSEMGIPMSGLDPRKIRIFGNGNGIVPEKNSDARYDDLIENAIYVHGEEDGVFDEGDYLLFYGQSSVQWNYVPFEGYGIFLHEINAYTDHTYYFINVGEASGKRVIPASNTGLVPTKYVSEFTDYVAHENDEINILKTGREWYGETYGEIRSYEYSFSFPNISDNYPVSLSTNIAAHSTIASNFDFYYGEQHLLQAPISKIINGTTVYAWTTTPDTVGFYPETDDLMIRVEYDKPTTTSKGWMNYLSLNARRKLIFTPPFMSFRDHLSFGQGEVVEYKISGLSENLHVWDVTDPFNITLQEGTLAAGKFTFRSPAEEIREFVAFDNSGFLSVEFVEAVANQNLHGFESADYIILSHPDFIPQAERMLELHRMIDNMTGFIVTPQQVYNEFGSGKQDPSAIRDFVRMLYENADTLMGPKYLLLMGDASYDYKDRLPDNTNYIPAYQSVESLKLGYSFVTDDYFGLLDPGEGVNGYGKSLEIGIGRFPVHTVSQADQMVDKVESYLTLKPQVFDSWRNLVGFIADDEDQNLHFNQAEKLEYMLDTGYHQYNCPKIYLDAFPQESTPSGHLYPEVNKAIDDLVESGCLIVNYTGHGGERGWAHEGVLDIATINNWSNWDRLPLFITATCEFSRYDDPSMISAGEWVFLNPYGGGVGLLTTSRLAWADPNFRLNKAVYQFMFRQKEGEFYKIGDVVRLAKTDQNNGTNIKNFVLLGDPAMQIAYPELRVKTLTINGKNISFQGNDTLSSMSEVEIHGMISDYTGDTVSDFNGILIPKMLDKDVTMSTLGNDPGSIPAQFTVLGQQLFSGKVTVENGLFTFSMFMPQNMASNIGLGKISYYAYDTVYLRDAHGYSRVKAGGVNPDAAPDNEGPDLSLYMNSTDFVSGGLTDSEPVFLAYLTDEHGINYTGNGIGRDIAMTLDDDPQTTVVLNRIFDPDLDSYQGGWVSYPLSGLEDGVHTLTLKAWDNMNISSEKSITFEVNVDGPVALTKVYNYPNPFVDETSFTFNHNKPGNSFDIEIKIFNISGQHVRTLQDYSTAEGLGINPIVWDGTNEGGQELGSGIYIYRMFVTDEQGNQSVQSSKLIYGGRP